MVITQFLRVGVEIIVMKQSTQMHQRKLHNYRQSSINLQRRSLTTYCWNVSNRFKPPSKSGWTCSRSSLSSSSSSLCLSGSVVTTCMLPAPLDVPPAGTASFSVRISAKRNIMHSEATQQTAMPPPHRRLLTRPRERAMLGEVEPSVLGSPGGDTGL